MTNIAETKSLVDHSFVMTIDGQSVTSASVAPVHNPATAQLWLMFRSRPAKFWTGP